MFGIWLVVLLGIIVILIIKERFNWKLGHYPRRRGRKPAGGSYSTKPPGNA